jgi:hypothetical protein
MPVRRLMKKAEGLGDRTGTDGQGLIVEVDLHGQSLTGRGRRGVVKSG